MTLEDHIRSIPDWPQPGILFRDVTTLFKDGPAFAAAIERLATRYRANPPRKVAGMEARGFVVGAALALSLGAGFVPLRKPGKLPGATLGRDYALEYGTARLEMHVDAVAPGESVLVVDDLIATGGTAIAAVEMIRAVGGIVCGCAFLIDLPDLGGRARLDAMGCDTFALMTFPGH